jgi:sensor histidine kinase YesM
MRLAGKHIDNHKIIFHALFWLTWVISFTLVQSLGVGKNEFFVWLMYYIITLPVFVIHTYIIAYWLIPRTFYKNRFLLLFLGAFILLLIFSVLELIISNELVFKIFDESKAFNSGYLDFKNIVISGIGNHYIILVFLAIKVGKAWYQSQTKKIEIQQMNIETELEIYRYQLQPKVMLNLMEELGYISRNDPKKSSEMIIRISNFLNQLLHESREELIPLSEEIDIVKSFLGIHVYTLGNRLINNFNISGNLKSFVVPPLLMLSVINNAIKVAYRCNNSFESTVIIKAEKKYLLLTFTLWSEQEFRLDTFDAIEITKKRLDYRFPGKYRLIDDEDSNFRQISVEIFL